MNPINRIHSFQDLCDLIAKDLAVFHDGIENTADDFKEESVVIATCIKNYIRGLLANKATPTLSQELGKIFNIQLAESFNNHDLQPKIRPQITNRLSRDGRTIRRRSSASSFVSVRGNRTESMEKHSGGLHVIRRIENSTNT